MPNDHPRILSGDELQFTMPEDDNQSPLIVSVSGIRGIVGQSLTAPIAYRYALAYGRHFKGKVIVGRDSRKSGIGLKRAVTQGLIDAGCKVIDLGIATTPTVEMAVLFKKTAGGVIITASHNPAQWNGLKFLRSDGTFLRSQEIETVFQNIESSRNFKISNSKASSWTGAETKHIEATLNIINLRAIRQRHFSVALDTVNGAGGRIAVRLLQKLGCQVYAVNTKMDGNFAHWPEPTPANLESFGRFVSENSVDIGFAIDPDADRLVLVASSGEVINEEYTLALVVNHHLKNIRTGSVVINEMTSRTSEDIARHWNAKLFRAPVGEINVVEAMIAQEAVIGGEGNGGIIDPRAHLGRDGLVGMALILEYLAISNKPLSELIQELPKYALLKEKVEISDFNFKALVQNLKKVFRNSVITETDGVRLSWPDRWVQVRLSNTEPIIRIFAESPTLKQSQRLIKAVKNLL